MSGNQDSFHERRSGDTIMEMTLDRIDTIGRIASAANADTLSRLDTHIKECAATQKWILRTAIGLCGWVIFHSPEVLGGLAKMLDGIAK